MPRRKKNLFYTTETSVQIPLQHEEAKGFTWRKVRVLNSQGFVLRHEYFIYIESSPIFSTSKMPVYRKPDLILESKNKFETFRQYYERDQDFDAACVASALVA